MANPESSAASGADSVTAQEDNALFVLQTNAAGGGIFHLLNLELETLDLFLT